jgi:hypothetical protein
MSLPISRLQMPDHTLSLSEQASKNIYHKFVQNNLIIKQGILDKKKVYKFKFIMLIYTDFKGFICQTTYVSYY